MLPSCAQTSSHLRSMPWWDEADVPFTARLEEHAAAIRSEFFDIVLSGRLRLHPQSRGGPRRQRTDGDWNIYALATAGRVDRRNALEAPFTSALIGSSPDVVGHPNGLAYFSVLQPGVHVDAHCGPTNARIRIHLGLVVPAGAELRVGAETRTWAEGRCTVFDDSWEHEVFNRAERARSVLLVDTWHPDLTADERRALAAEPLNRSASRQQQREGWYRSADADEANAGDAAAALSTVGADRRASLERTARTVSSAPGAAGAAAAYGLAVMAGRTADAAGQLDPVTEDDAAAWDSLADVFGSPAAGRLDADDCANLVHLQSIAWRANRRNRERMHAAIDAAPVAERAALLERLVALERPAAMARACDRLQFGSTAPLVVTALRAVARG